MEASPFQVIVIHDGLILQFDPLLIELQNTFGEQNVIHFENSNTGLNYVTSNLNRRMVVLLDINFSKGELSGIQVFENIKEKTSLIYVIMVTARNLSEISNEDLILMINHDAFALANVFSYPKIISLVNEAIHKMEVRVDSALEQFINTHTSEEQNKPYVTSRNGMTYSLKELITEIRLQTDFGRTIEKQILLLAIDMLARGKKTLDG